MAAATVAPIARVFSGSSSGSSSSSIGDAAKLQQQLKEKMACEELLNVQRQQVDKFKTFGWGFV
jgi:hypothetical protein